MKTRAFRTSFSLAIGVALFTALSAALPQAAQAQAADIAVLRAKVENTDSAIERMDKRLDRMDERLDRMEGRLVRLEEIVIRLDERMNALQSQSSKFFYIFFSLHILTITGLIGLLTRGVLWGVARAPKASSGESPHWGVTP